MKTPPRFLKALLAATALLALAQAHAGTAFVSQDGAALAPVSATGTAANPYQLGTLAALPSSLFVTLTTPGSFTEYADFTVGPSGGLVGAVANTYALSFALPSGPVVVGSISDFSLTIGSGTPGAGTTQLAGSFAAGASNPPFELAPGSYFAALSGVAQGVGGQYSTALVVAPIPEADSALMMLGGLSLLGIGRLRRRG